MRVNLLFSCLCFNLVICLLKALISHYTSLHPPIYYGPYPYLVEIDLLVPSVESLDLLFLHRSSFGPHFVSYLRLRESLLIAFIDSPSFFRSYRSNPSLSVSPLVTRCFLSVTGVLNYREFP